MIANSTDLTVAVRQLRIMEDARKALNHQLSATNPDLLDVTEKAYINRIEALQADISHYLCDHPTEVSLLIRPLESLNPSMTDIVEN